MKKATFKISSCYRLCPHCKETVSLLTFYAHKALYYKDGEWSKKHKKNIDIQKQEPAVRIE